MTAQLAPAEPTLSVRPRRIRQDILDKVRACLSELPSYYTEGYAASLLRDMDPTSGLQSWVLLRNVLHETDPSLESLVASECRLTHSATLDSAMTGADVIPVLHSICSNFMDAYGACLDSWRGVLRDVTGRFGQDIRLDGEIKDYVLNMARFKAWPGDGEFAIFVQEVYARHGRYGEICDMCEEILGFEHKDAQYALPRAHIESSIASLADHAIAQNAPNDGRLIGRCAGILKKRALAIGVEASQFGAESTFEEVSESAHSLAHARKGSSPPSWALQYATDYPFMYKEFTRHVLPINSPMPQTITTEQHARDGLVLATRQLREALTLNSTILRDAMYNMEIHVNKGMSFDAPLQKYITDMARFGSGAAEGLALRVLLDLCIGRKMYNEVYGMCKELSEFSGADAQRMASSTLIENAIGELLQHMSRADEPADDELVSKCATLLEQRSGSLGLGLVLCSHSCDKITQAGLMASDISARKRMRDPEEICAWTRDNYPLSYEFLDLAVHADDLVASKSSLAYHASSRMASLERAAIYKRGYSSYGALDDLEELLGAMAKDHIDPNPGKWKKPMRSLEMWHALLEMNLYVRCKMSGLDAIPHPAIDDGRHADLEVDGCYIEAYLPLDPFILVSGYVSHDFAQQVSYKFARKLMDKPQIKSLGGRQSILVVECHWDTFNDPEFHQLLEAELRRSPSPGGILLALRKGGCYETHYIENAGAAAPVDKETLEPIRSALGLGI